MTQSSWLKCTKEGKKQINNNNNKKNDDKIEL